METRVSVPSDVHQSILNASIRLKGAAVGINRWATWESICQAEVAMQAAMEELRSIKPNLRRLKSEVRRKEVKASVARKEVA